MQTESLRLALKALDPDTFQKLCFHLLKEKHPELAPKHVEGKGGDQGLDVFAGELYGLLTIWQCKSFPNGVGPSQRDKIKESLRTALKHFSPSFWILCLSVDMDAKAHRWFEKLKKAYASKVKITDFSASEIVHELMYRRTLRNMFFPNVVIDIPELKRQMTGTGKLSATELESATDQQVEDLIERYKDQDSRFRYELIFDGESGPPSPHIPIPPGLVMTVANGTKKLNVYARDVQALQANPPRFTIGFTPTGVEKLRAFIDTGAAQDFQVGDLGLFTPGNLPLLKGSPITLQKLFMAPSPALAARKRSVRVIFQKSDTERIQYNLMEMNPVQVGRKETTFAVSHSRVPLHIRFVLPTLITLSPGSKSDISIEFEDKKHDVRELKKALDALAVIRPAGKLQVIDIETDRTFFDANVEVPEEEAKLAGYRNLLGELVKIADRFKVNIQVPSKMTKKDLEAIGVLKTYMDNGTLELRDISITLVKSTENKDALPEQFASGRGFFRFTNEQHTPIPEIFGTPINTGPVAMDVEAEIRKLPDTIEKFRRARIGAGVKMSFRPLGPVRVSLLSEPDNGISLQKATSNA